MKISIHGLNLIKDFEGFFSKPYICPAGKITIGWGSTFYENGVLVTLDDPAISRERAQEILEFEINQKTSILNNIIIVPINQNEFDAIACWCYNVGEGAVHGSTLLKLLNAGKEDVDREAVGDQFLRWDKAGGKVLAGLTRRRQAERALFLQPVDESLPDGPSEEEIEQHLGQVEQEVLNKG